MEDEQSFIIVSKKKTKKKQNVRGLPILTRVNHNTSSNGQKERAKSGPKSQRELKQPATPLNNTPSLDIQPSNDSPIILERSVNEYIENPAFIVELDRNKMQYLLKHLPEHAVEVRIKIKEKCNDLLSKWDVLDAINTHELEYLKLLQNQSEQCEKLSCSKQYYSAPQTSEYLEPGLINVFDTHESFLLQPISEEEKKIPFLFISKSKPFRPRQEQAPVYAVPTRAEFMERFQIFTAKQFSGWRDWSNMVVVGGAVCNCLLPIPPSFAKKTEEFYHKVAYKTSDIDIYCYGLSLDQLMQKIFDFYNYLSERNGGQRVLVFNTPHTVTLVTAYPQRHIQFVIGEWKTIENILFEPDVDCSCVAFDGSNVWATQRSKFSLTHRVIVASPTRYGVRGFPEYEIRLVKYSKRGFMIWDRKLDWNKVSEHYIRMAHTRIGERLTCRDRVSVRGLRLLIALHAYKDQFSTTDIMTVQQEIICPETDFLPTWVFPMAINGQPAGSLLPTKRANSCTLAIMACRK